MENNAKEDPKKGEQMPETQPETAIKKEDRLQLYAALELVTKLGVSIALIAGGFLYVGIQLDQWFGTRYVFVFLGLVLSIIVSIYDIYFLLEPFIGSERRKNFLRRRKK